MKKQNFQSLDSVKLIAIVLIVIYHYNVHDLGYSDYIYPLKGNPFIDLLSERGYLLVEVLFMISGFLICHGYLNRIKNGEVSFSQFIVKRLKKLYPLFIISTVLMCLVDVFHRSLTGKFVFNLYHTSQLILNVLFIQTGWLGRDTSGNHIAWYLSVLFFCYILFYVTIIRIDDKDFYTAIIIYIMVGLSCMVLNLNYPIFNSFMGRGVACFSIGIIIYKLNNLLIDRLKEILCILGLASLGVIGGGHFWFQSRNR